MKRMFGHTKPVMQGTYAPVKCIASETGKFFLPLVISFSISLLLRLSMHAPGEEEVWKDDFGAYVMGRLRDGVARLGIRGA